MRLDLKIPGKVVIVTGAASGIGEAIVREFLAAEAGGVVAVDINPDLAAIFYEEKNHYKEKLQLFVGDVSLESTAAAYTKLAIDHFGKIDVMINNAAVSVVKSVIEHTPEEWDRVMNVNVKSIYLSARCVVPVMRRRGGGVFLNSGSISGVVGIHTQGAYAPSKGAVNQMTRQMAIEFAKDNIRVNAICPGTVDTPLVRKSAQASGDPEGYMRMLEEGHPLGRIASASEIAKFYLFMASDDAQFFTGSILMVDGGFTAK
jgi:NAD(P)-dependent dehydrogenase (short-subunit alcohol dehydrogenase family)